MCCTQTEFTLFQRLKLHSCSYNENLLSAQLQTRFIILFIIRNNTISAKVSTTNM